MVVSPTCTVCGDILRCSCTKLVDICADDSDDEIVNGMNWLEIADDTKISAIADFGRCDAELVDLLFKHINSGLVQVWYSENMYIDMPQCEKIAQSDNTAVLSNNFQQFCNIEGAFGVMPWKLFRLGIHYITPRRGHLNNHRALATNLLSDVTTLRASPEKKDEITKKYVKKVEWTDYD